MILGINYASLIVRNVVRMNLFCPIYLLMCNCNGRLSIDLDLTTWKKEQNFSSERGEFRA